jgi:hypothetical protein
VTDARHRYPTAAAFRTALEDHLRRRARSTGTPLDRLRKEIAHQRLLARLAVVAPPGSWALKGGQALLARLDTAARATKDADATWRAELAHLGDILEEAVDVDLGDGFRFEVGAARLMTAETDEGGVRYPVLALLDGREFERLQLDVNAVPDDHRPLDQLQLRDLLGFAGIEPPTVPVISIAQHLAEKLHAYVRDSEVRSAADHATSTTCSSSPGHCPSRRSESFIRLAGRRSPCGKRAGHPHCQHRQAPGRPRGAPS